MTNDTQTTAGKLEVLIREQYSTACSLSRMTEAILAEFVVIPRSELPEAKEYEDPRFGTTVQFGSQHFRGSSAQIRREQGLQFLALAEHLDAREAEAVATEVRLNARRDELAREFSGGKFNYADVEISGTITNAIDYILDLEDRCRA